MEKPPPRSKGSRILKFLPKATSFSIPNPPYSPGRDKAHHRGFSGPIISIVPADARRRNSGRGGYQTPEPTSPKVSCIGQIKHKKKKKAYRPVRGPSPPKRPAEGKPRFTLGRMFRGMGKHGKGAGAEKPPLAPVRAAPAPAPPLGQLRRFASGGEGLRGFQWGDPLVAEEKGEGHVEREMDDEDGEEEEEEEVAMPGSADVVVVGAVALEPRKEVNIWKRRTVAPLTPLQV